MKRILAGLVLLSWGYSLGAGSQGASPFLFLSDQRIVTLEVANSSSLILNYINLGSSFELLEARQLILVDEQQRVYRGHLFLMDESEGASRPYATNYLVKPGEFSGFVVVGAFDFLSSLQKVYFKVSGRILEFERVDSGNFEVVASRIGELDLSIEDRKIAIERAGFTRGFGRLLYSGSAEAGDLDTLFTEDKVVPPIALETPRPRLPSSDAQLEDPVVVRVSARVSRSGSLRDIEVVEGINDKLDQIAMETVRNSWKFLPAISEKEVAEAELKLNIIFNR